MNVNGYNFINPDDFEVRDVIKVINSNLEYVYQNQTSIIQTVLNLIPYSSFSVITNIDYWQPYNRSNIVITDNKLVAYSDDSTVGVVTPALSTSVAAGDIYTLSLRCKVNVRDAILNDFFIVDQSDISYRINHDEPIPFNTSGVITKTFTVTQSIENPRFIIGTSDVESTSAVDYYKFVDRIKDSLFIQDGIVLPYIDTYKAKYDQDIVPLKNTLSYLLVNYNSELYNSL